MNTLFRVSWSSVSLEIGVVLPRMGDDLKEPLEGLKVLPFDSGFDDFLHKVVAGDEGWALTAHAGGEGVVGGWLFGQATVPKRRPGVVGGGIGEEGAYDAVPVRCRRGVRKTAEGEGEVGLVGGHASEEILGEGVVAFALGEEAKLAAETGPAGTVELRGEGGEGIRGGGHGGLFASLFLLQERKQGFGEAGEVPVGGVRLVAV